MQNDLVNVTLMGISIQQDQMIDIVITLLGGVFTVTAAYLGIVTVFRQIRKQFEQKIVYEAWKDLQLKIYSCNSALSTYIVNLMSLNSLKKEGKLTNEYKKYLKSIQIDEKSFIKSYQEVLGTFVDLSNTFKSHEVVFLGLNKTYALLEKEVHANITDKASIFFLFLYEAIEKSSKKSLLETSTLIDEHTSAVLNISNYLDDMRIELQNETVGKILGFVVPKRKIKKGEKSLTKAGWRIQT